MLLFCFVFELPARPLHRGINPWRTGSGPAKNPAEKGHGRKRRKEAHDRGRSPPQTTIESCASRPCLPGPWPWTWAQQHWYANEPRSLSPTQLLVACQSRVCREGAMPDPEGSASFQTRPEYLSPACEGSCLGLGRWGASSSPVFIFIRTKITRRQCVSNRDEKRKRKGLWEVGLLIQRNSGFYGNRSGIVWLVQLPLPPPSVGAQLSLHCVCAANFSPLHSSPAPGGPQRQRPSPRKREGEKGCRRLG